MMNLGVWRLGIADSLAMDNVGMSMILLGPGGIIFSPHQRLKITPEREKNLTTGVQLDEFSDFFKSSFRDTLSLSL